MYSGIISCVCTHGEVGGMRISMLPDQSFVCAHVWVQFPPSPSSLLMSPFAWSSSFFSFLSPSVPLLLATFCHPLLLPPSGGADKQLGLVAQLMPSPGVRGVLGLPHGEQNKSPPQSAQQPPALGLGCRLYLQIQISWFTAPCQTCAFFFIFFFLDA